MPREFGFVTERHAIVIDGMAYPVHRNEALLCQFLSARREQYFSAEQLCALLSCSARSLRDYAVTIRSVINPYGFHIEAHKKKDSLGYRFTEKGTKHAPDQDIRSLEASPRRAHKIFLPRRLPLQRKMA